MPLFKRPDGDEIKQNTLVRKMIPYLMKGRNESIVYHEQLLDLSETLPFIEAWNANIEDRHKKLTLFHLVMAGIGKGMIERPGLNRFVSGGRIYQRKKTEIAFSAKKRFADYSALTTQKIEMLPDEPLSKTVQRLQDSVVDTKKHKKSTTDKEVSLLLKLPGPVLGGLVDVVKKADAWNLLPKPFIDNDPMFASFFVANLGSVGIDRTWHHLYEYGNISLFCVIGAITKSVLVGEDDQPVVKPTVRLRFAFDERINDGHYCAASLAIMRDYIEHPSRFTAEEESGTNVAESIAEDAKRHDAAVDYEKKAS